MIQSMTGFGKATLQLPTKKITVEIKSLNSKGLDLNTRMPSVFREMELGLRNQISQRLERGKIDFSLYVEVTGEETSSKINVPIVKGYINQMKAVIPNADETELMKMAVRMPDALKTERDEIDENEWQQIQTVIDEALANIVQFRKDEGVSLEKEFLHRIANIMTLMNNAFRFAMSISSEIMGHVRKGKYVKEDAAGMQNVIWDHVNNDMLPILLKRPIKDDGTVMEIPELRPHLIGIMNDEYVKKPRATPDTNRGGNTEVNWDARRKIARLLDCHIDPVTMDLVPNEERDLKTTGQLRPRTLVPAVPLPKLEEAEPQKAAAPKVQGPAPAMA